MRGAIPPLLQYAFMAWCLVKHRDKFTFYLYLYHVNEWPTSHSNLCHCHDIICDQLLVSDNVRFDSNIDGDFGRITFSCVSRSLCGFYEHYMDLKL
jgi:hypothetical protein